MKSYIAHYILVYTFIWILHDVESVEESLIAFKTFLQQSCIQQFWMTLSLFDGHSSFWMFKVIETVVRVILEPVNEIRRCCCYM